MDIKAKGQHAQRLLDDEVLQNAFSVVKEYHTEAFSRASATDSEVLEARRMVLALEQIKGQLRAFVSDGRILEKKDQDRGND